MQVIAPNLERVQAPVIAPPVVQAAPPPVTKVVEPTPVTLYVEPQGEQPAPPPPPPPRSDLGPGFPTAPSGETTLAERMHALLAKDPTGGYDFVIDKVLQRVSSVTQQSAGIDVSGLLDVEQTLFKTLAGGIENYKGGVPPLFMALADGQAAYVSLGKKREDEADHLMRMFAGLPLDLIGTMDSPEDVEMDAVRRILLEKAQNKEFPVYVDIDGKCGELTPTETIATESIGSIARRENQLGSDFPDPRLYYKWLVTRVDSNYRRLDPWLFGVNQPLHDKINKIKENATPPWIHDKNINDPFGATPQTGKIKKAYQTFMEVAGNGQPPTWDTLSDVADTVVGLDRDLLSGIQTYWIKLLSEVSVPQRESMMAPVSRAWVKLNTVPPTSPEFERVSPENAPYIELLDRHSAQVVMERYDRSLAMGQGVDHMLAGLGIQERRQFLDQLMADIREHQPELEAREARLRAKLGDEYRGLDIDALLHDRQDINSKGVKEALDDLIKASKPPGETSLHEMTPEYADIVRHRDMMDWVATRFSRYGDLAFDHLMSLQRGGEFAKDPLILGEYYEPAPPGPITPLPSTGPTGKLVLGQPVPGKAPIKATAVYEGGGGKGNAYVCVNTEVEEALDQGAGQIEIDEFAGNSAGGLMAGLRAAGYSRGELPDVLKQLDPKRFYSDYLWLSGGVDPKVRGINRTGLFSMQKMYKTLSEMLKKKVPVEGRPVLFRDLPYKLRVTSTVLNANIPDDVREKLNIQGDGQVVFSTETTPNMDVAAAMCCSAAIPGFFNAPQVQLCGAERSNTGSPKLHRMQLVDGGTVNNFPITAASQDDKSFLLMLPTYFQAKSQNGETVTLSALNFADANLPKIDAYNRERYSTLKGKLKESIMAAADKGYERVVLGFNLSSIQEQTGPVIQGHTREESKELVKLAHDHNLPVLSASDGAAVVRQTVQGKPRGFLEQHALNLLVDKSDAFHPKGLFGSPPRYSMGTDEAAGITDMLAHALAANMTAPSFIQERLFEKEC